MMVYRRMMDKILEKDEDETFVTNPKEPIRTLFRKLAFRLAVWRSKLGRAGRRRSAPGGTKDARK